MDILFGNHSLKGKLHKGTADSGVCALLLHPHPLYGGDMNNQVVLLLEQFLMDFGVSTFRFNFRGTTAGSAYEGPNGSLHDSVDALDYIRTKIGMTTIGIIGYSFGGSIGIAASVKREMEFLVTLSASFDIFRETQVGENELHTITCPTLMFHGDDDAMVPFSDMATISNLIGENANVIELEKEGHFYTSTMDLVLLHLHDHLNSFLKL